MKSKWNICCILKIFKIMYMYPWTKITATDFVYVLFFDLLQFQNICFKILQSIWITFPFFHILRIASVLQFVYGHCSVYLFICLFFSVPLQNTLPHKYIITIGYELQNLSVGLAPAALSKEGFLSYNTRHIGIFYK